LTGNTNGEKKKANIIDRILVTETEEHHQTHDRRRKKTKYVTVGLSCDCVDDGLQNGANKANHTEPNQTQPHHTQTTVKSIQHMIHMRR
jgi:hypothetical protein